MNWKEFKSVLKGNLEAPLQFEYQQNQWAHNSFHLTEFKQAHIVSVDCGGQKNEWNEIIVQVWEPPVLQLGPPMKAQKAMEIIDLVEKAVTFDENAEVKVEYGNANFGTRQMPVTGFQLINDHLVAQMQDDKTLCKAIGRGESCGTEPADGIQMEESCCAPAPIVEMVLEGNEGESCAPGSGCC